MTDELRKAAEIALEALEYIHTETSKDEDELIHSAIQALRQALSQTEQECIYPECETGIGCDGPCGEKPVDTVKQEPAVYKCPRCATSMDVDLNAKPVDTINTSQERETAKRGHEPVVFYRCNGCGHAYEQVAPSSCDCMEGTGFLRVNYYTAPPKREWVGLTDEDIKDCESWCGDQHDFAYEIEAKLKEKNT